MNKLRATKIDLPMKGREKTVEILNQILADVSDLISQTKQAHWNVRGPRFISLHELYDKLAVSLDPFVDELAERITTLGGIAYGTSRWVAKNSQLTELPLSSKGGQEFVPELIERYAAAAKAIRGAIEETDQIGDADTADLLTGLSRATDKALWFLEAHQND